ncbi:MAG: phosphatidylinositol mannoside acyltransferase [Acidimicrobiales bacterium]|nr:phosphatidylinositol mannoside acyltransferase [Acidimicrobiales bacterium]
MDRTTLVYRGGAAVARTLPAPVAFRAADLGGRLVSRLSPGQRRQVERNLRRVLGPGLSGGRLDRLVADTFAAYARYWAESARLPAMTDAEVDVGFTYDGFGHIEDAMASGVGPILALPHLGGWEWAGMWLARVAGYPVYAVVEPQEPPELFEWMIEYREAFGLHVVPLGPKVAPELLRILRSGSVLCLLCDRDIGGGGVEVEFFGERTTLPGGPATLSLRTGAAILPTAVYHVPGGTHGVVRPPVTIERTGRLRDDVVALTQAVTRELEALIRAAPQQWHVMQPNWPSDHVPGVR